MVGRSSGEIGTRNINFEAGECEKLERIILIFAVQKKTNLTPGGVYLEEDKASHRKQRHTKKRIFERLRDEQGYTGSYRSVCKALEKMEAKKKTLFAGV